MISHKTPDEILADEVLCHIGRPLSPEHLSSYSAWARVWNPINLTRFSLKDHMTTSIFNRVWTRVTTALIPSINDNMRQVQESCGDVSPSRVGRQISFMPRWRGTDG